MCSSEENVPGWNLSYVEVCCASACTVAPKGRASLGYAEGQKDHHRSLLGMRMDKWTASNWVYFSPASSDLTRFDAVSGAAAKKATLEPPPSS